MKQYRDTPYYVTEHGKIYRNGRELKGFILKKNGKPTYHIVQLHNKKYYTHRLVAEVYIPNPNNLPQVDHLDTNKLNNHYTNLEWVTNDENRRRAIKNGLMKKGEEYEHTKLTTEQVLWIKENYIPRHPEFGGAALARKFNIGNAQISRIINNKRWKHL